MIEIFNLSQLINWKKGRGKLGLFEPLPGSWNSNEGSKNQKRVGIDLYCCILLCTKNDNGLINSQFTTHNSQLK